MKIKCLSLGPIGTNCYILSKKNKGLIVDPGAEADRIIEYLKLEKIDPLAILLTHAHFDHIGAVDQLRDQYAIFAYLHKGEANWMADPDLNGSNHFPLGQITAKPADYFFNEEVMSIGDFSFKILETPGHSPGGVSFVFAEEQIVLSGDCLFQQSIGRTDLIGGNQAKLIASIKNVLFRLPDRYTVYPGHGPKTDIKFERNHNPFL
ncbi:Glyoxylase, beta-lactamase superfamily II [Amphibacillus marinus]|uniref:Glyoxylase, beta-lactamase superfamily II n=1 Tax=Amphibacillus marinus TaxID=872970 RepID=A0A1H8HFE0_9BACI|nr:MBL fold metallo-hydrolase [Amphibacillus marinus]SEN54627.1 Glyoxylase, beta-lactamase superfamily II [Amphibacillus marinus]